jgi:hypothetical protein
MCEKKNKKKKTHGDLWRIFLVIIPLRDDGKLSRK